jgi:nucleoside-diphosphate-sugar epimerase
MIVIFGASTSIGMGLADELNRAGKPIRRVFHKSRNGETMTSVVADLNSGAGVSEALAEASVVVSCAHARYTQRILEMLPPGVQKLVLVGSAWRYSRTKNPRADEVRAAEKEFIASGRDGVMLHPTMIYGGRQENNILRLLAVIQRFPLIPAPGGGKHRVQPIYVDDVVSALHAAVNRSWQGPNVVPLAGPPLSWREMVRLCSVAIGVRRPIVSVPAAPIVAALNCLRLIGVTTIDPGIVKRFAEDVDVPVMSMQEQLSVSPREFRTGIAAAVADWRRSGQLS